MHYPSRIFMTDVNHPQLPRWLPRHTHMIIRGHTLADKESLLRQALARRRRDVSIALSCESVLERRYRKHLDGLHLPEKLVRSQCLRQRQNWLITRAWHGNRRSRPLPWQADAVVLSPVLATASHPEQQPLGWPKARFLAKTSPVPVYFMGGLAKAPNRHKRWAGTRAFYL